MRKLFAVVLVVLGSVAYAQGDDIQATIDAQISAFSEDDFAKAFSYASPSIQRIFGDEDRFEAMVRRGYPMVVEPKEVRYFQTRQDEIGYRQQVLFLDQSGASHLLEYQLVQIDGEWRINGVWMVPLGPAA
ncbi:DUF4864 domain-containing protein [Cognatishimia maritima]|uniref:DUF4864 domain-containing protein n=1 Tax=Cognatishimia maritima TaxID=870908 RepID=A0A1M5L541_9RHOB|nr:DUF4864 domain-containing protein [Cognatishimia maritima]SHG60055.1 protein of unknown function [Cognatishimia maritima]